MNLFGWEIKKKPREELKPVKNNQLVRRLLSPFQYNRPMDYDTDISAQLGAFRSWVYVASSLNASSVSQTPLRLYVAKPTVSAKSLYPTREISRETKDYLYDHHKIWNIKAVRTSSDIEEVLDHPFFDLIRRVNNFTNSYDLWEMNQLYLELTGNSYLYLPNANKMKIPQEIWIIPPDRIRPIAHPTDFVSGYRYDYNGQTIDFKEEEVIHFKFPNPKNLYVGASPLIAGIASYNLNENMATFSNEMFRNQGRPSGFFTSADQLDKEEFDRLKIELREAYSGMKNAGKVGLLDSGLEFKQLNLNADELAYIDGRRLTKEELLNIYGQNIAMWSENANRANAEAANREYMRRTVRPRCIRIAEKLNEKLLPKYDERLFCAFEDVSSEDRLISTKIAEMEIRSGLLTINEGRKARRRLPVEGGEEPMVQLQYVPLSLAASGATLRNNNQNDVSVDETQKPSKDEKPKPKKDDMKKIVEEIKMQLAS